MASVQVELEQQWQVSLSKISAPTDPSKLVSNPEATLGSLLSALELILLLRIRVDIG